MVTSTLTVRQLELSIQGPGDLPGKTIGTAVGSIAADYLTALHLPYATITTVQEGYDRCSTAVCRLSCSTRRRHIRGNLRQMVRADEVTRLVRGPVGC